MIARGVAKHVSLNLGSGRCSSGELRQQPRQLTSEWLGSVTLWSSCGVQHVALSACGLIHIASSHHIDTSTLVWCSGLRYSLAVVFPTAPSGRHTLTTSLTSRARPPSHTATLPCPSTTRPRPRGLPVRSAPGLLSDCPSVRPSISGARRSDERTVGLLSVPRTPASRLHRVNGGAGAGCSEEALSSRESAAGWQWSCIEEAVGSIEHCDGQTADGWRPEKCSVCGRERCGEHESSGQDGVTGGRTPIGRGRTSIS